LHRSHDGSTLMFSSADGYCSAAVFSNGELGLKYEKALETVQEYDVEMMDIPIPTTVTQKRSIAPTLVASTIKQDDKSKKRRITPILLSTPNK
jgi:chromatin assembly factor 1 subunit B